MSFLLYTSYVVYGRGSVAVIIVIVIVTVIVILLPNIRGEGQGGGMSCSRSEFGKAPCSAVLGLPTPPQCIVKIMHAVHLAPRQYCRKGKKS
jgi:hypothetical protein